MRTLGRSCASRSWAHAGWPRVARHRRRFGRARWEIPAGGGQNFGGGTTRVWSRRRSVGWATWREKPSAFGCRSRPGRHPEPATAGRLPLAIRPFIRPAAWPVGVACPMLSVASSSRQEACTHRNAPSIGGTPHKQGGRAGRIRPIGEARPADGRADGPANGMRARACGTGVPRPAAACGADRRRGIPPSESLAFRAVTDRNPHPWPVLTHRVFAWRRGAAHPAPPQR